MKKKLLLQSLNKKNRCFCKLYLVGVKLVAEKSESPNKSDRVSVNFLYQNKKVNITWIFLHQQKLKEREKLICRRDSRSLLKIFTTFVTILKFTMKPNHEIELLFWKLNYYFEHTTKKVIRIFREKTTSDKHILKSKKKSKRDILHTHILLKNKLFYQTTNKSHKEEKKNYYSTFFFFIYFFITIWQKKLVALNITWNFFFLNIWNINVLKKNIS